MRIFFDSSSNDKRHPMIGYLPMVLLFLISSITCVSCFDVGVSPGSICCGDWITVTISVTNTGNSVFSGRAEIYIVEANGYKIPMDGLSITLQPHESRTLQTKIRPRDCKSYGTYQVVVKLVADNGQEQGTRTSTFAVKDPASCPGGGSGGKQQGCTWTFNCENNVVRRLCIDQYGREYWQDYDNCNSYNPPRECINGVCVDTSTPGGSDQPKQACNQQACQSQNKAIGTSYTKDGTQYQKYMQCNCVNDQCNCEEIEKEIPCNGVISGYVYDSVTNQPINDANIFFCQGYCGPSHNSDDSGYFSADSSCPSINTYVECHAEDYKSDNISITTDNEGNANIRFNLEPKSKPEVPCSGIVSGNVKNAITGEPIENAIIHITQNNYLPICPTNALGDFMVSGSCPSALATISCSAEGYIPVTKIAVANLNGNLEENFALDALPLRSDLSIVDIKCPSEIGLGQEIDVEITLKNIGNNEVKDEIPAVLRLLDDATKPGHHGIWAQLSPDKYQILQEKFLKIDLSPRELNLRPGQTTTYHVNFIISDNFDQGCIFANTLRVELSKNNYKDKEVIVSLGTRAEYCLNLYFLMGIGEALGKVIPGGDIALDVSQNLNDMLEENYRASIEAIKKGDTITAAKTIIEMGYKMSVILFPDTPDVSHIRSTFVVTFAKSLWANTIDAGKCLGASSVIINNLWQNLLNEMLKQGMQSAVETLKELEKQRQPISA